MEPEQIATIIGTVIAFLYAFFQGSAWLARLRESKKGKVASALIAATTDTYYKLVRLEKDKNPSIKLSVSQSDRAMDRTLSLAHELADIDGVTIPKVVSIPRAKAFVEEIIGCLKTGSAVSKLLLCGLLAFALCAGAGVGCTTVSSRYKDTDTEWSHKVLAPPFVDIDKSAYNMRYFARITGDQDEGGVVDNTYDISQGEDTKTDSSGQVQAFATAIAGLQKAWQAVAPMLPSILEILKGPGASPAGASPGPLMQNAPEALVLRGAQ